MTPHILSPPSSKINLRYLSHFPVPKSRSYLIFLQKMAMMTVLLSVLALCAIASNVESASHHNAPAPAVDCTSLVLNMADCLSYVSNGSTAKKPDGNCCSGLKKVLKTDAECLCEAFKNSAQLGLTLNMTKALALPSACHLSAPSLSKCGLSLGPGSAPAMSPVVAISPSAIAGVPTGTNEVSPAPAPAPATATPTGKSGSAALATSVGSLILALVVVASFSYA